MHDLCKTNIVLYLGLSIYINIAYDMVIRWSRFSVLHIYKIFIERAYITICLRNIFAYFLCSVHASFGSWFATSMYLASLLLSNMMCEQRLLLMYKVSLSLFAIRITLRNPVITFHLPLPIRAFCRRTHIVYLICMLLVLKRKIACKGKVELDIGTI